MRWLITVLIILAWLVRPIVAEACSCGVASGYPADGDTAVPTDVHIAYPQSDSIAPELRRADGSVVPTRVRSEVGVALSTTWFLLAPLEDLAPETEYELSGSSTIHFTTGKGRTTTIPDSADVLDLFLAHSNGLESCEASLCFNSDERRTTALRYWPSLGAVYYELIISVEGETWRRLAPLDFYGRLGGFCVPGPTFEPGQSVCAELIAVGSNGARAASGEIACRTAQSCPVVDCDLDGLQNCHRADFTAGPEDVSPPNGGDSGCSVRGKGSMWGAACLLILVLGMRRKRRGAFARSLSI